MNKLALVVVMVLAFPAGRIAAESEKPISLVQELNPVEIGFAQLKTTDIEEATYELFLPDGGKCSAVAIAPSYLLSADHCIREKTGMGSALYPVEEWKLPVEGLPVGLQTRDETPLTGTIVASSLYTESMLIRMDSTVEWMEISSQVAPGMNIESAGFPNSEYKTGEGMTLEEYKCVDEWSPYVSGCIGHTIDTRPGWSGGGIASNGRIIGIVHGWEPVGNSRIGLMIPGELICKFLNEAVSETDRGEIRNCE